MAIVNGALAKREGLKLHSNVVRNRKAYGASGFSDEDRRCCGERVETELQTLPSSVTGAGYLPIIASLSSPKELFSSHVLWR